MCGEEVQSTSAAAHIDRGQHRNYILHIGQRTLTHKHTHAHICGGTCWIKYPDLTVHQCSDMFICFWLKLVPALVRRSSALRFLFWTIRSALQQLGTDWLLMSNWGESSVLLNKPRWGLGNIHLALAISGIDSIWFRLGSFDWISILKTENILRFPDKIRK